MPELVDDPDADRSDDAVMRNLGSCQSVKIIISMIQSWTTWNVCSWTYRHLCSELECFHLEALIRCCSKRHRCYFFVFIASTKL